METPDLIDVLVVDGHIMVAKGLAMLLGSDLTIKVVGTASTIPEAVKRCRAIFPDVVVIDVDSSDGGGMAAISAIRASAPGTKILVVGGSTGDDALAVAVDADCDGYINKSADVEELIVAIHSAVAGRAHFSPVALARLLHERRMRSGGCQAVSEREREVLQLLADGSTVAEIATRLDLSTHTVRNHLRRAMKHLGVHSRLDAVVTAVRAGILSVDDAHPLKAMSG